MAPILATRDLGLDIGGAHIVADVSLEVTEGEFIGIIGPNGAGKTTLFNLLSGLAHPTAGSIELGGRDITSDPPVPPHPGGARPDLPGVERLSAADRGGERAPLGRGAPRRHAQPVAPRRRLPAGDRPGGLGARAGRPRRPRVGSRRDALARRQAQARARDVARRRPSRDPPRRADGGGVRRGRRQPRGR